MARPAPTLRPLDVYVYQAKGVSDPSRVPAPGATFAFFEQGATAAGPDVFFPAGDFEPQDVNVYHVGSFEPGDHTILDGNPAHKLVVVAVDAVANALRIRQDSLYDLTIGEGRRLLNNSRLVPAYEDPGARILKSALVTDENGRFCGYLPAYRFDYSIVVSGDTQARVFPDAIGSYVMR